MMSRLAEAGEDEDEDPIEAAMRSIRNGIVVNDEDIVRADGGDDDGEGDGEMDKEAFSKLLSESLASMGLGGEGGAEGAFNPQMMQQMMMQMMSEMMNREHLYEPIADLATRLPTWLEENKGKVDDETWEKHSKQLECYQKIVAAFDSDPVDQEAVQENMILVQTFGPPPRDLVPEEHRNALDEMMAQAPASSSDDAEALRAMMKGAGAGGDNGCPMQ